MWAYSVLRIEMKNSLEVKFSKQTCTHAPLVIQPPSLPLSIYVNLNQSKDLLTELNEIFWDSSGTSRISHGVLGVFSRPAVWSHWMSPHLNTAHTTWTFLTRTQSNFDLNDFKIPTFAKKKHKEANLRSQAVRSAVRVALCALLGTHFKTHTHTHTAGRTLRVGCECPFPFHT